TDNLIPPPAPPPDPAQARGVASTGSLFDDEPLNFDDLFVDFDADTLSAAAKTLELDSDAPAPHPHHLTPAADAASTERPATQPPGLQATPDTELEAALDHWVNGSPDATAPDDASQATAGPLSASASEASREAISEARIYAAYGHY